MKQWIRTNSLQLPDGTLMANNGVHEAIGGTPTQSKRAVPTKTKRSVVGIDPFPPGFSLSKREDADMACRRSAQLHEDAQYLKGSWSCDGTGPQTRGLMAGVKNLIASLK